MWTVKRSLIPISLSPSLGGMGPGTPESPLTHSAVPLLFLAEATALGPQRTYVNTTKSSWARPGECSARAQLQKPSAGDQKRPAAGGGMLRRPLVPGSEPSELRDRPCWRALPSRGCLVNCAPACLRVPRLRPRSMPRSPADREAPQGGMQLLRQASAGVQRISKRGAAAAETKCKQRGRTA
ncbi:UNVERIFIED_CONTAM: hypothetical protein K2H54_071936 [Gekko kuhli]